MPSIRWTDSCAYNPERKRAFHQEATKRLQILARLLQLRPGTYEIRSNKGGIAVSGEITLHHDDVYVQVSQFSGSPGNGVLIRTCDGRTDYTGGRNHIAPLRDLDNVDELARKVRAVMATKQPRHEPDADASPSARPF